jgi:rubrerythrin
MVQSLRDRLRALGQELAAREAEHRVALDEARQRAAGLRAEVAEALAGWREAVSAAGAPQLAVTLGELRPDDKHVRAVEFNLARGRHRAVVTVKARGEVTLVGPFHAGKTEGPCKSFPFDAEEEIRKALGDFLERFLAEAATP